MYSALSGMLFNNLDGRRFKAAGWKDTGKSWGVLASDLLNKGSPQLYVANDMMPGDLWVQKSGAWQNEGPASASAYDSQGGLQGRHGRRLWRL